MHDIRWITLDGVVNMRDVGGMPTTDGGQIAEGRLIRSDNLQQLTPSDIDRLLGEFGVTDIIDLRSHVERSREGDGPLVGHPGVRIATFTLYADDAPETGIPNPERELPWEIQARRYRERSHDSAAATERPRIVPGGVEHDAFWSSHYLGYLSERPESVVAAVRAISQAQGAALVHCAAGKDRTGTIVGLALSAAGADREAVTADYAATGERVAQIIERLAVRPAYADNLRGKSVAEQMPREDTMRRLLSTLDEHRGGVLGWLMAHGWTEADQARLRAKLLA